MNAETREQAREAAQRFATEYLPASGLHDVYKVDTRRKRARDKLPPAATKERYHDTGHAR
jgi:hypothetical protein